MVINNFGINFLGCCLAKMDKDKSSESCNDFLGVNSHYNKIKNLESVKEIVRSMILSDVLNNKVGRVDRKACCRCQEPQQQC